MIVILNCFRNAYHLDEIHQDAFCEGDWRKCMEVKVGGDITKGRFYPISNESIDFATDRITSFDGQPSNRTIEYNVFLN